MAPWGVCVARPPPGPVLTAALCFQALIPLSLEGTEVGQAKAAQALAKIIITSNPEMAFPGERVARPGAVWAARGVLPQGVVLQDVDPPQPGAPKRLIRGEEGKGA